MDNKADVTRGTPSDEFTWTGNPEPWPQDGSGSLDPLDGRNAAEIPCYICHAPHEDKRRPDQMMFNSICDKCDAELCEDVKAWMSREGISPIVGDQRLAPPL